MRLVDLKIGFGTLRYVAGEEEVPSSVTKEANITVHNHGRLGSPDYYDVSFPVSATVEVDGASSFTVFTVSIPVTGKSGQSSYTEIEGEAARQIAPVLRLFVEDIERQVDASDNQQNCSAAQ